MGRQHATFVLHSQTVVKLLLISTVTAVRPIVLVLTCTTCITYNALRRKRVSQLTTKPSAAYIIILFLGIGLVVIILLQFLSNV